MLSSKMMKEMESEWFNYFHLKTRIKTGTPTVQYFCCLPINRQPFRKQMPLAINESSLQWPCSKKPNAGSACLGGFVLGIMLSVPTKRFMNQHLQQPKTYKASINCFICSSQQPGTVSQTVFISFHSDEKIKEQMVTHSKSQSFCYLKEGFNSSGSKTSVQFTLPVHLRNQKSLGRFIIC